jgi:hypothetical protein
MEVAVTTPTPQEAQRALDDIEQRKHQSAAAARSSRWWWYGCGVLLIAYGVATELAPGFMDDWSTVLVWVIVCVAIARSSRWGSRFFGRQVRPRLAGSLAQRIWGAVAFAIALMLLTLGAIRLDVPHLGLWFSTAGGLFLILAGPWWESRMLARGSRP